jgi:hypothetical protein
LAWSPAKKRAAGPEPAARRRHTALTDDVEGNIGAQEGFVTGDDVELLAAAIAVILLVGWAFLNRGHAPNEAEYVKPIADHLRLRGEQVVSHRLEGFDVAPFARDVNIRKYSIEVQLPNGERRTRMIGVQNSLSGDPKFWRYGSKGERRPMF